jgi:hypothetical protein
MQNKGLGERERRGRERERERVVERHTYTESEQDREMERINQTRGRACCISQCVRHAAQIRRTILFRAADVVQAIILGTRKNVVGL